VGLWRRWLADGQLYDVGSYVDGQKTGLWKTYNAQGKLKREKLFSSKSESKPTAKRK